MNFEIRRLFAESRFEAVTLYAALLALLPERFLFRFPHGVDGFQLRGLGVAENAAMAFGDHTAHAGSWFILGIWYGWGYCICTDWHWQVRRALGFHDGGHSYTYLMIHTLTGLDPSPITTDILTGGVFAVTTVLTVVLNLRDRRA